MKACFLDRCNYFVGPDWSAFPAANLSPKESIDFEGDERMGFLVNITQHFLGCKAPPVLCCVGWNVPVMPSGHQRVIR